MRDKRLFHYLNLRDHTISMNKNAGQTDRIIRGVVAVAALGLAFSLQGTMRYVAFVVAGIAGGTALAGYCPLYTLFGIKTCPCDKK